MRKYLILFTLTGETVGRFTRNPSDRAAIVGKLAEGAGGKLEAYYWMFGQYDGLVIVSMPDSESIAALSLAVSGTGAFSHLETHELVEASDLVNIGRRAQEMQANYQAPGATS